MVHRKELSTNQCAQITALQGQGLSLNQIAGIIGCAKTTVFNTIRNFEQHGNYASAAQSGPLGGIPVQTLCNSAYQAGINCRIALKKPFLTARNKVKQLNWALSNQSTDWKHILFTDESTVQLGKRLGYTWVSQQAQTRNLLEYMVPTFWSGRFSIHVWARIRYNIKTRLYVIPLSPCKKRPKQNKWALAKTLTAKKYSNFILGGPLKSTVEQAALAGIELEVVKDGAKIHWANITKERQNKWALMKHRLSKQVPQPQTHEELAKAAEEAWNEIPMDHINASIDSKEERVAQVISKQGDPLKY
ncbi:uncharacterized protein UTRI_05420 [Ustilago trichophora]|uniref:Transposase n=1 Tax=Ustilago trichophora TaxID=86804 RepID=A0A5C3EGE8_9BASI|nr:uncharacterized protein UTRI_05420 [Ustilago trichophora]